MGRYNYWHQEFNLKQTFRTAKFKLNIKFFGACSVVDLSKICKFFSTSSSIMIVFTILQNFISIRQKEPCLRRKYVDFQKMLSDPCLNIAECGKSVFHLNQFHFRKWIQLCQEKSQIGHKQKHLIFANCYNYSIIIGKCKCLDGNFIYSGILKG